MRPNTGAQPAGGCPDDPSAPDSIRGRLQSALPGAGASAAESLALAPSTVAHPALGPVPAASAGGGKRPLLRGRGTFGKGLPGEGARAAAPLRARRVVQRSPTRSAPRSRLESGASSSRPKPARHSWVQRSPALAGTAPVRGSGGFGKGTLCLTRHRGRIHLPGSPVSRTREALVRHPCSRCTLMMPVGPGTGGIAMRTTAARQRVAKPTARRSTACRPTRHPQTWHEPSCRAKRCPRRSDRPPPSSFASP